MTTLLDAPPLLAVDEVHKTYPSGTRALRGVTMAVRPGSVHGLVGANGAGKSTLIKILCGVETATQGGVTWRGEAVRWSRPSDALASGMGTVHQHTPLVGTMSVVDNVFLGHGGVRWEEGARERQLQALCDRVGYQVDPDAPVGALSVGSRQMISILQALARDPAALLLDEPTAALSPHEREVLFRAIRRLRDDGTALVYVSHFLDEVLALTDHLTVLRDGRVVVDAETSDTTEDSLVEAIVGERLARAEKPVSTREISTDVVLAVRDLTAPGVGPVGFDLHRGEVLGVAGLLGSGRTELLQAVYGAEPSARGTVEVAGRRLRHRSPAAAVRAGLALVPEDRARQGLIRDWEIWRNTSLPYLRRWSWRRWIPRDADERAVADRAVRDLGIKTGSIDTPVAELSGGNAQKVVFAKWLYGSAQALLLDEPSAGVDVGAKADIIGLIRRLASEGTGVVIVSSEFEELLGACDRIVVLRRGRIVGERRTADTDLHELTALASGLSEEDRS